MLQVYVGAVGFDLLIKYTMTPKPINRKPMAAKTKAHPWKERKVWPAFRRPVTVFSKFDR
jgi:hypothetical protein